MKKNIYIFIALLIFAFLFFKDNSVKLGPGVMAAENPVQFKIRASNNFEFNEYQIKPLAEFSIKAKVLSRKNYSRGREADLSPLDLALGWGNMSDEDILKSIRIWQANRWYFWWSRKFPISRREIETHSANMHIIPANDSIKAILKDVRKGDIVEFRGMLVSVKADDGWRWRSSLSRNDTGGHSCELVWVEDFDIKNMTD